MLQCTKDDEDNGTHSVPIIEWIPGTTTITYAYAGGVVSGFNFYSDFEVSNKSGNVCIEAHNQDANISSCNTSFFVEIGKRYTIKVLGTKTGSRVAVQDAYCMSIVFCSLNCRENCEIEVVPYLVPGNNEYTDDQYYCPTGIELTEIILTEAE